MSKSPAIPSPRSTLRTSPGLGPTAPPSARGDGPWRLVLMPVGVALTLLFAFVGLYVGLQRHPNPRGIPVAIVGRPLAHAVTRALGDTVSVHEVDTESGGVAELHKRDVAGIFSGSGATYQLEVAGADGASTTAALDGRLQAFALGRHASVRVSDMVPRAAGDTRGLAGFYVAFGTTLAALVLAQAMAAQKHLIAARRRHLTVMVFAIISGSAAALLAGPILGVVPGNVFGLGLPLALLSAATATTTLAAIAWLGPLGVPLATILLVSLGNSTSGAVVGYELLPEPARWVSGALPPGAAFRAVLDIGYFHWHHAAPSLLVLGAWTVAAGALLLFDGRRTVIRGRHEAPPHLPHRRPASATAA